MELRLQGAPEPALVGFSGGADSTALLLLLLEAGWNDLLAVHFNHHLRGDDADRDQKWCEKFCNERHISFISKDLYINEVRLAGESVETAARRCRLEAWRRLAAETGRKVVFLGHHADDALEEFLLRLGRGANATGLTSLRAERDFGGAFRLVRPLLDFRKAELEAYLRGKGIADWRVDATNLEACCRRNAVRHRLIPLIREIFGTDKGFRQSLRVLRDDALRLEEEACALAAGGELPLAAWRALPKALLQRVLRSRFPEIACTAETVDRLHATLRQGDAAPRLVTVDAHRALCVRPSGLEVVETGLAVPPSSVPSPSVWRWREEPLLAWHGADGRVWCFEASAVQTAGRIAAAGEWLERFDADALPDELVVRVWRPGDRLRPFGDHGHHRKLQDIFSDAHVPCEARRAWPLLEGGGEIVWLPGLVRAEIGRVAAATQRIVALRCTMASAGEGNR